MTTKHVQPSDTFSFGRFGKLLYAETLTHGKSTAIKLLALFLPSIALFSLIGYKITPLALDENLISNGGWWFLFIITFSAGFMATFILGILSATQSFKAYHRRETGFAAFMLPASNLEKFCTAYLVHALFVPIAYFVLFRLSAVPSFVALNHAIAEHLNEFQTFGIQPGNISFNFLPFIATFTYFIAAQAIFFAGSITFRTCPFFKTILVIIVIAILLWFTKNFLGSPTLVSFFTSEEANSDHIATIISNTFILVIAVGIARFKFSRAVLK